MASPLGRGGVPARGHHGGGVHVPSRTGGFHGRGARQVPGHDRRGASMFRPGHTIIADTRPRSSVTVVSTHSNGRISGLATMIVGIALAIFGACILPVDPVGGIVIGGLGLFIAGIGALAYGANRHDDV